ncbi:MAG: hypothetical protein FJY67_00945 [Calditrichaeota bacterium]|nr:hypothetical protein [Calditrichota bacterium]
MSPPDGGCQVKTPDTTNYRPIRRYANRPHPFGGSESAATRIAFIISADSLCRRVSPPDGGCQVKTPDTTNYRPIRRYANRLHPFGGSESAATRIAFIISADSLCRRVSPPDGGCQVKTPDTTNYRPIRRYANRLHPFGGSESAATRREMGILQALLFSRGKGRSP